MIIVCVLLHFFPYDSSDRFFSSSWHHFLIVGAVLLLFHSLIRFAVLFFACGKKCLQREL